MEVLIKNGGEETGVHGQETESGKKEKTKGNQSGIHKNLWIESTRKAQPNS